LPATGDYNVKKLYLEYSGSPDGWYRLNHDEAPRPYRVKKVVGSTSYSPGAILTKAEVDDLCEMTGTWTVTIEHPTK